MLFKTKKIIFELLNILIGNFLVIRPINIFPMILLIWELMLIDAGRYNYFILKPFKAKENV